MLVGCKDFFNGNDMRLKLANNSNMNIYYSFSFVYPDTTLKMVYPPFNPLLSSQANKILPKRQSDLTINARRWEYVFENELKDGILIIFIFEGDLIEKMPWEQVVKEYKILKRYEFTLEDIKKQNWVINYL
jgi:hypothetical protein